MARAAEIKVKPDCDEYFCSRRVVSRPKQRRQRDEAMRSRMDVNARPNQKFNRGIGAGVFCSLVFPENFHAEIKFLVNHCITERSTSRDFGLAFAASLLLECEIAGPVPAMEKSVTEKQL